MRQVDPRILKLAAGMKKRAIKEQRDVKFWDLYERAEEYIRTKQQQAQEVNKV